MPGGVPPREVVVRRGNAAYWGLASTVAIVVGACRPTSASGPSAIPAAVTSEVKSVAASPSAGAASRAQKPWVEDGFAATPFDALRAQYAIDNAGDRAAYVGPVYSYYEFPSRERLTDEEWQQQIQAGTLPERPAWTRSFQATAVRQLAR
jgi:hypothetical protein